MSFNPVERPNPYVGPRAIRRDEPIFGRDRETSQLINLIVAERVVLLYSPSGAGKTSLIQAALIPRLKSMKFQVLPVVRVNLLPPPELTAGENWNRYVFSTLLSLEEEPPADEKIPPEQLAAMSLVEYLQARSKSGTEPWVEVLIFDQFEDILTLDPTDQEQKREFFRQLGEALDVSQRWALFAMREDYVTALDPYVLPVPSRLRNTFRLDLLGEEAARQAIREPARRAGVDFEETAVRKLVDDLRRVRVQGTDGTLHPRLGPNVEPVQLQVVCYRLWAAKSADGNVITEADLTDYGEVDRSLVDRSLAEYYSNQVAVAAQETGVSERIIREWFDRQLITEHGARGTVLMTPEESGGLDNRTIHRLIDAHLVRAEKRGGMTWFELAHDRLIAPVRQDNAAWARSNLSLLQQQADLWERQGKPESLLLRGKDYRDAQFWAEQHQDDLLPVEEEYLSACQALFRHEQRAKRLNRTIAVLGIAAMVLALVAYLALLRSQRAEEEARRQERVALAGMLAAHSQAALGDRPQRSLLLAVEAVRITRDAGEPRVPAAEEALRLALEEPRGIPLSGHQGAIRELGISPDGRWLVTGSTDATARLWDLTDGSADLNPLVLSGHAGEVAALGFSPDGRWLATGGEDGSIRVWDLAAADPSSNPRLLSGYEGFIIALDFSPDGRWLAAGGADAAILIWDLGAENPDGPAFWLSGTQSAVTSLDFGPDGSRLASAYLDATVLLWEPALEGSGGPLPDPIELPGMERQATALAFSPDGRWLAAGGEDATAFLWDVAAADPAPSPAPLRGHAGTITALAYSPDGRWLATGSEDATARLWDLGAADPASDPAILRGHDGTIRTLAYSPDGRWLATGSADHTVRLWDLSAADPASDPAILRGHDGAIQALAFSPDGRWLATGSEDATARLWDLSNPNDQNNPVVLPGYEDWKAAQGFGSGGAWWVAGEEGETIRLRDLLNPDTDSNLDFQHGHDGGVSALALSPDGRWLASGGEDATIRVWDLEAASPPSQPDYQIRHSGPVSFLAISPDGRRLAAGGADDRLTLYDLAVSDPTANPQSLQRPGGVIWTAGFSADGRWLAAGSSDGTAHLWDLTAANPADSLLDLPGHTRAIWSLAFSPDGRWLATGSLDGTARLWDLSAGDPADNAYELRGHSSLISAAAFSRDGHWLATGGEDAALRLWDLTRLGSDLRPVALQGHRDSINNLAFSPDGRWLASGSVDAEIRLWLVEMDELVRLACQKAGRNFYREEWQTFFSGVEYHKTCDQWPEGR